MQDLSPLEVMALDASFKAGWLASGTENDLRNNGPAIKLLALKLIVSSWRSTNVGRDANARISTSKNKAYIHLNGVQGTLK